MPTKPRTKPLALPVYQQVKQHVLTRIATGEWRTGEQLPGEYQLADTLSVSRLTVHRALRELAQEGVLRRHHGLGTFVAQAQPGFDTVRLHNIADEVRAAGQRFSAEVIGLEAAKADAETAAAMRVSPGSLLFHSRIVYRADDVPVQLECRHVAPGFAPDFLNQDFRHQSTTDYLRAIAPPTEAEHVIDAMVPDAGTRRALQMQRGEPCLVVTRTTWVDEQITTFSRFIHPASRRRFISRVRAGRSIA
jgi:GntR family histidine utilization transcriptional repressor